MLNENAKKWVAALRSGEYKQAKQYLRRGNSYCCLGVLCDLYAKDRLVQWNGNTFDNRDQDLSSNVCAWVGLRDRDGAYMTKSGVEISLTNRNDTGNTFSEIADIIESEPEGLFIK